MISFIYVLFLLLFLWFFCWLDVNVEALLDDIDELLCLGRLRLQGTSVDLGRRRYPRLNTKYRVYLALGYLSFFFGSIFEQVDGSTFLFLQNTGQI